MKPNGPQPSLVDSFGRVHDNLRISVTDRCNIRCFYCMPETDVQFMDRSELLSFEEIEYFVRVISKVGVRKIRLTGGEPLVRRGLASLVEKLSGIEGIRDIALTTNGILLPQQARELYQAGLRRINIHLDTLDPDRFFQITRRTGIESVIEGIQLCKQLGFGPIKINAVAARGTIEDDVVPLGQFARESGVEVRFIEYMPLDADNAWEREKVFFADEILQRLSREVAPLIEVPNQDPRNPAREYVFADDQARIGIIASVSRPFCQSCNRIRLTADGKIRNCLFSHDEYDVRDLIRSGESEQKLLSAVSKAVWAKKEGHEINTSRFIQPPRPMYSIGG